MNKQTYDNIANKIAVQVYKTKFNKDVLQLNDLARQQLIDKKSILLNDLNTKLDGLNTIDDILAFVDKQSKAASPAERVLARHSDLLESVAVDYLENEPLVPPTAIKPEMIALLAILNKGVQHLNFVKDTIAKIGPDTPVSPQLLEDVSMLFKNNIDKNVDDIAANLNSLSYSEDAKQLALDLKAYKDFKDLLDMCNIGIRFLEKTIALLSKVENLEDLIGDEENINHLVETISNENIKTLMHTLLMFARIKWACKIGDALITEIKSLI